MCEAMSEGIGSPSFSMMIIVRPGVAVRRSVMLCAWASMAFLMMLRSTWRSWSRSVVSVGSTGRSAVEVAVGMVGSGECVDEVGPDMWSLIEGAGAEVEDSASG